MILPTYTGTADAEPGDVCATPRCGRPAVLRVLTRYEPGDDRTTPLCVRHGPATVAAVRAMLGATELDA